MKYVVNLDRISGAENFDEKKDNILLVHVKGIGGEDIASKCKVKFSLSKDSMLGLGKSLIRYAHEKEKIGGPLHFDKMRPNNGIIATLGVFLIPESVELIVGEHTDEPINQYLAQDSI